MVGEFSEDLLVCQEHYENLGFYGRCNGEMLKVLEQRKEMTLIYVLYED